MSGGVGKALDEAVQQAGAPQLADQAAQPSLFEDEAGELTAEETGALDAPSPLSAAVAQAKRPRGRPKGSKNRRTEAVAAWLLSQHRHPLAVMMEAYSMSPADLARTIGIEEADGDTLLDIFKLQLRMAEAVAPYVAQRQPQAVNLDPSAGAAAFAVAFAGVSFGGVSSPARAGSAGEISDVIEGQALAVRLGKSDG